MDFLTFWIIICVINAILSFILNSHILKHGEDVSYSLLFIEIIVTLASFIGLLFAIIIAILAFLMEHGDDPAIKSKHRKN